MISTLTRRSSASFGSSRSHVLGLAALEVLEQRRLLSAASAIDVHEAHEHHNLVLPARLQPLAVEVEDEGYVRDISGETYFFDAAPAAFAQTGEPSAADGGSGGDWGTGGGGLAGAVPAFHSNPGAPQKIFLDFDGHIVDGTLWNNYNNGNPIHAQPYSQDEDIFNLSSAELASIEETFLRVAEDFAPFNVDVTTQDPGSAAFKAGGQALRVLVSTDVDSTATGGTGNRWFEGAGGVAYLGSWRWTSDTPVWAFENNLGNGFAKYVAEAASHEVGHAFDLMHDGQNGGDGAYYRGHGTGATSWAPIMGVGYSRSLTQWSKGDYNIANNTEDDLAIITASRNNVTFRTDDHGNTAGSATAVTGTETGTSSSPYLQFKTSGIIERRTDVDVFKFDLSAGDGRLTLAVAPEVYLSGYTNLDVSATLRNAAGNVVAQSNPLEGLDAFLDLQLSAGVYTLSIDGVGKGDPYGLGYSDYGSLGQYDIFADYAYSTGGSQDELKVSVNGVDTSFPTSAFSGYSNQDTAGKLAIVDGGAGVKLTGNTWKKLALPYNVTADTVLEFDVSSADPGEILAISFDNNNIHNDAKRHFRIGGFAGWSDYNFTDFKLGDYGPISGRMTIPVGQFYTGQMQYLGFALDDDADASGDAKFSNIKVFEDTTQNDTFTVNVNGTPKSFGVNSFTSYSNQDTKPGLSILNDANGFRLFNNSWKKLALPYNVTADTMIEFDVSTTDAGEIIAVGFDDDNVFDNGNAKSFQVAGSQPWNHAYQNFAGTPSDGSTRRVVIPAGQFYTGAMQYLMFGMDDDADASGNMNISNFKVYEKSSGFDGFAEQNGLVVMEAENATGGAAGTGAASGSNWQTLSDTAASGGSALAAMPNTGVNTGDGTAGPRQDYAVRFTTPGTWYAWVRMLGANGTDDSLHLGIDGAPLTLGRMGVGNGSGAWAWMNNTGGGAIQFNVPAAGDHVFNLWMREDGVKVDKLVLTRDPNYRPSGTGPGQTSGTPAASPMFSQMAIGDGSSLFTPEDDSEPDAHPLFA